MADEETTVPTPAEAAPGGLFKFTTWIHVGGGAEECSEVDEDAGTNRCSDSGHFHAWCRLPNPLQEREIRERAQASRARRIRQLRLQGSDQNEILETELESLQAEPDAMEQLANELVNTDWAADYLAAVREVRDLDDDSEGADEGDKLFGHIEDDQIRFNRLQALPEEERSADEFEELQRHLTDYQDRATARFEELQRPKKESYLAMDLLDLLDLVRRKRIERVGTEEFMHHFGIHEWLSCTYRERQGELAFRDLAHLEGAAPEVLRALEEAFNDLEATARAAPGN